MELCSRVYKTLTTLTSTRVSASHFCRAWELIFSLNCKSWNLQPSVQHLCVIGLVCSAEPPVRQSPRGFIRNILQSVNCHLLTNSHFIRNISYCFYSEKIKQSESILKHSVTSFKQKQSDLSLLAKEGL